jgi:hypothetical protein
VVLATAEDCATIYQQLEAIVHTLVQKPPSGMLNSVVFYHTDVHPEHMTLRILRGLPHSRANHYTYVFSESTLEWLPENTDNPVFQLFWELTKLKSKELRLRYRAAGGWFPRLRGRNYKIRRVLLNTAPWGDV